MVVEDERGFVRVLGRYLRREGFESPLAATVPLRCWSLARWTPDLYVLDLGLPSLDGVEVCRQIRTF